MQLTATDIAHTVVRMSVLGTWVSYSPINTPFGVQTRTMY